MALIEARESTVVMGAEGNAKDGGVTSCELRSVSTGNKLYF